MEGPYPTLVEGALEIALIEAVVQGLWIGEWAPVSPIEPWAPAELEPATKQDHAMG